MNGSIKEIVKKEGDFVKSGDTILIISNGEENTQRLEYKNILKENEEKIKLLKKYRKSLDEKILKEKQNKLKDLKVEYRKFTKVQEEKSKIDSEYENIKSKYEGLKTEIESLKDEISQLTRQKLGGKQSEQIYLQLVNEIGSEIKNIEKTNLDIKMNISVLKNRDTNYEIKANKDGEIHYVNPLKEGVNVQVNQTLIELSKLDKNNFYVDTYINIYDISKVKVNQEVDIAILVVIEDGVVNIQGQEGNNSFYKAKVEIENKYLEKNNEKIELLLSMPVEARIIYDKETYLEYVLEKLNFRE